MTEKERMVAGKLNYFLDAELEKDNKKAKRLTALYNSTTEEQQEDRKEILKELLGKGAENVAIVPPFRCDYGQHIEFAGFAFLNYDCIILDACKVSFGENVLVGPRTCIYSATHPIDAGVRNQGYDIAKPVTIGNGVWIGGNCVVNPGVKIGDNTVIGSGSVVTKDIPSNVIACGNPCRVIREITADDKAYWEGLKEEYLSSKESTN